MVMDSSTRRSLAAAMGGAFGAPGPPGLMSPLGQQQAGPYNRFSFPNPGVSDPFSVAQAIQQRKLQDERIGELEREVEALRPETALEHVLAAPLRAVKDLRSCIRKEADRLEDEVERRARR